MDALTIRTRGRIDEKGELHTEQPLALAPGEYEITLVAEPAAGELPAPRRRLELPCYPIGPLDPASTFSREEIFDDD